MDLIRVLQLSGRQNDQEIVRGVSFLLKKRWKLAIAGETGSGKSSLLKMMAGLMQPTEGSILFEGKKVFGPDEKLIPGHPGIAYLSQQFELPQNLRVEQVLEYANEWTAEEASSLYQVCQIDHLLKRKTSQLSGGEKQRIALARLLSGSPRLLLLDEPYSNLDMIHKQDLKKVIRDLGEKLGITCVLVSHDPQDLLSWADEILVIRAGKIVQQAGPEEIYRRPVNEYVAGMFGKYNLMEGKDGRRRMIRPEDIAVVPKSWSGTLSAKVMRRSFWGNGYELEVLVEEQGVGENLLTIRTQDAIPLAGDSVHILFSSAEECYI